ncbi:cobalt-precorrin-6B (C15)-methyltransferase [Clostridium acetobutylicum]|uniref:Precorrin-6B methylase CbiT n=1 Tax=Clostridium acetobutylicum (strain ATCC 824 / DSM 792 / JCM 1419 / IAM 19013 / LMG 5710 / NBRC 13948 / NRRL B-527 / VKM B-1787 / 2291 / W) TaxID=272562 RepID=Q97JA8_CLOAB|nr:MULTISPECIES: precorrin-6Y C5,15-methyltransferase (decarboxylating) subunit CbiT [Clostridium]AAK79346.1 Precorrin-6B methylase CbiT [Clostridium acetobutylicum ATCC 824]ADZ20429.1 Precorrin-6B methylase CbiT [Clostridium acetobutylicum EA 2018]AEI33700.1 precorrin-6B methylase CbiT [Clostridium acetobutylicum DSM 1731]AWV81405.1 precorrin-6Y C5,15-methyltransferase (decarboxylating) subunit CbiT [Clostridium acetobutylicum]MBC2393040.1 precorrin-6Y C5,15-methyltransferase (decarboxylating
MIYIKDEEFIRGDCPMTKEEVRILSIAKLEIEEDDTLLDIGAGTGSISIQMSKCTPKGKVIAIEREEKALKVLEKNKEKFKAHNLYIIKGDASQLNLDESFDGVFIGGSSGNIDKIIKSYALKLKKGGKMVMNFITLDNLYRAIETLKELNFEVECSQIAVSKMRAKSYMMLSNNPIFIVTGKVMEG